MPYTLKSIWTHPTELLDDVCHMESHFGLLLVILNIITKSRLTFLILVTVPKMPNLSLIPLKPSCHPQHDMRDAVMKYAIALLNK